MAPYLTCPAEAPASAASRSGNPSYENHDFRKSPIGVDAGNGLRLSSFVYRIIISLVVLLRLPTRSSQLCWSSKHICRCRDALR